ALGVYAVDLCTVGVYAVDLKALVVYNVDLCSVGVEALGLCNVGLFTAQSPDTIPGPSPGPTVHKSCSQSFPCAGRSVRNAFLSHGPYPAKDKIHLARIIRRSYVGVELVQWLCEQCGYVRCRPTAARVWQVLLELGVLLSVDQRVIFADSNSYYQFSFEECESASCEFRSNEGEWSEAVRLLLTLAPYVQFRSGGGANSPSEEDSEGNRDICGEMLQMRALERLTSTVQNELAAALARKTRKALSEQDSETREAAQPPQPRTPTEESSPRGLGWPACAHSETAAAVAFAVEAFVSAALEEEEEEEEEEEVVEEVEEEEVEEVEEEEEEEEAERS
ncbi:unnamed protein product, partial [Arctogadus glacialis]